MVFSATCKARGHANDRISYVGQKKLAYLYAALALRRLLPMKLDGWDGKRKLAGIEAESPRRLIEGREKSCFVKKVSGEGRGSCLVGSIQRELARKKAGLKARWAEMMDWV